jgi:oxalate decarboxylase/phosphoglucose isomerase-like protein (cupin superfamily)
MIWLLAALLAASAWGADDTLKVVVDNDAVRVLKVIEKPHHPTALHEHPFNRVMVYLDAGDMEIRRQDGRVEKQHWTANQVAWSPANGMHVGENTGATPLRVVEIELKKPGPDRPVQRVREFDPVAIDSEHDPLLFENAQVRVFRSWREPGATEKMHEHPGAGRVSVLLADLDVRVKTSDGAVSPVKAAAGDVLWSLPARHAATNVGSRRFDMIIVEVK